MSTPKGRLCWHFHPFPCPLHRQRLAMPSVLEKRNAVVVWSGVSSLGRICLQSTWICFSFRVGFYYYGYTPSCLLRSLRKRWEGMVFHQLNSIITVHVCVRPGKTVRKRQSRRLYQTYLFVFVFNFFYSVVLPHHATRGTQFPSLVWWTVIAK